MLKRKFLKTLTDWKAAHRRECLLVKGARQIGKTYIIDHFGKTNYSSYLYIDFLANPEYRSIFEGSLEADAIFRRITAQISDFKLIPGETLIFLDEIQRCPKARTAFKQLAIDGRADVIGSGSLLGLTFLDDDPQLNRERRESSIPVGYERQIVMHPLDFEEYLWALGYDERTIGPLRECCERHMAVDTFINNKFLNLFREHIVIGGMPEVVSTFLSSNSFSEAHRVQEKIIESNLDDISRYALNTEKQKVRACYLSLPEQLARENRKFKYSAVEKGGSARKFSSSIDWLREASLALQCHNLSLPDIPLRAYKNHDCYKMYVADTGILCAMLGFGLKKAILDNTLNTPAKGGIYENAVMSALVKNGHEPFYYQPNPGRGEVDFIMEYKDSVVPLEVKAGNASSVSFDNILSSDHVRFGYKLISGNVGSVGKKITLPLYMASFIRCRSL